MRRGDLLIVWIRVYSTINVKSCEYNSVSRTILHFYSANLDAPAT